MSSFVTAPNTEVPQQVTLRAQKVHHTSRPRTNIMHTLGTSGIDLQPSILARTMDWTPNPYIALQDDIMRQLQSTSLETSSYSPDQQSPVNGTQAPLPTYQLYHSGPSISRQYGYSTDLRSQTLIDSACSNIDPQLQHSSPAYGGYGTRSLPNSIHNSPTSTPTHNYGPITMSTSPPRPLPLPRTNMLFCQQTPVQRTAVHVRESESETESQKSTSDASKNRAFLRKGRSGTVYTVCPKQLYRCLYDPKCGITKQKACDMKDHYYSVHAQFNCMQCDNCGNSYARPCTYKRHLKEDKTCPKPRTLTAEQVEQGALRRQIMECFGDMTNERMVKRGVTLMKKCNMRQDMRKRKRRVGYYRKQDSDDADDEDPKSTEQLVTDCVGTGSQFTAVNAHNLSYFPQPSSQTYSFHEPNQLFDFNAVPEITPRNYNPTQIESMFELGSFGLMGEDLNFE
ncbi:hypothetical protein L211DRAFT_143785 [Terfezia boudieri ATCC MYA-4762]|uniref:C2H2-type domain-containing protein n=1 Tax=Terfezia boudieri ATCC MYA-4762 TaxID=1051890 RepID=A0A3N4LPD3_9PEZI|nr:hypothetical protein L211DRAFT_143785 [Terfezia boudieri ATCC MYA-4762]